MTPIGSQMMAASTELSSLERYIGALQLLVYVWYWWWWWWWVCVDESLFVDVNMIKLNSILSTNKDSSHCSLAASTTANAIKPVTIHDRHSHGGRWQQQEHHHDQLSPSALMSLNKQNHHSIRSPPPIHIWATPPPLVDPSITNSRRRRIHVYKGCCS